MMENEEAVLKFLAECSVNTEKFGKTFMPKAFNRPFTEVHRTICRILDDDTKRNVVIAAPRGIGKTTLASAYLLKEIVFRRVKMLLYGSASEELAISGTEYLKEELESNPMLQELVGNVRSDTFSKENWVVEFADDVELDERTIRVFPRGSNQKIRGVKHRNRRPDLVLLDDFEGDDVILSETIRRQIRQRFWGALKHIGDVYGSSTRFIVIGTVLHEDSLLNRLLNNPRWTAIRLEACTEELESLIPEWISSEKIREMYAEAKAEGELEHFYRELRNSIVRSSGWFRESELLSYSPGELTDRRLRTLVTIDPASTSRERSNSTAVGCHSIDEEKGIWYVRRIVSGHFTPDEMIREAFELADEFEAEAIAVEVTGLNEFVTYPIRQAMVDRYECEKFQLIELRPIRSKTDRARSLIPWTRRGALRFPETGAEKLISAMLACPHNKNWDELDCTSAVVMVMDESDFIYQSGRQQHDSFEEVEKEFASLDAPSNVPLGERWKWAV